MNESTLGLFVIFHRSWGFLSTLFYKLILWHQGFLCYNQNSETGGAEDGTVFSAFFFIDGIKESDRMSLESMKMVEKAELDAKKLVTDAKAAAKTAAEAAAEAGRQHLDEETAKADKSAEEILENAKLVGKASCTDIERACEDSVARLRTAAEKNLPEAARFIAERITEGL